MPRKKTKKDDLQLYKSYANDVVSGKITACQNIIKACQKYLDLFNRKDLEFRPKEVDIFINFSKKIRQEDGSIFEIQPFQIWLLSNAFGFYYKGTDERLIKNFWFEVARKNGKTTFACIILIVLMLTNKGIELDLISNSKHQSMIAFEKISNMLQPLNRQGLFKFYRDKIKLPMKNNFLQSLSSDSTTLDGFSSYCFLADEAHSYPNSKLFDVMKSSQGHYQSPMAITITTSGFDLSSFCYGMHETYLDVLNGVKEDDSVFCAIYTLDDGDDWQDPKNWIKSNPCLGVSLTENSLKDAVQQAINNPTLEISTRTKIFNQWLSTSTVWISDNIITKSMKKVDFDDFKNEELFCFLGVDLSAVSDLTAVSYLLPFDDKLIFKTLYYLPESLLKNNVNSSMYREWSEQGYLNITNGNVTDYDYITNTIIKINEDYPNMPIQLIGYDRWNATQWAIKCQELGLPLQTISQSIASLNMPTKELQRRILGDSVIIDNNPITRYCFQNCKPKFDYNDNIKIVKGGSDSQKIDGVISMIMALMCYLSSINFTNEIEVIDAI